MNLKLFNYLKKSKVFYIFCIIVIINIGYGLCEKFATGSFFPTIEFVDTYPQIVNDTFKRARPNDEHCPDILYNAVYLPKGKQIYVASPFKKKRLIAHELCHWFVYTYHLPKNTNSFIDRYLTVDTSAESLAFQANSFLIR